MILGEFAVNPDVIKEWRDLRMITMNFGFDHGAVISLFPKNWIAGLKQKAETDLKGTKEYLNVIEKLNTIKNEVLIKSGREYDPTQDWINNSIRQHQAKNFYKIIHIDDLPAHTYVIGFDELDEAVFKDLREGKIKRKASVMAEVSRLLLVNSKNIQFIDPFFSAKDTKFFKTLEEMLCVADFDRRNNVSIQIHASYIQSKVEVDIEREKISLDNYFKTKISAGKSIEFYWWDDQGSAEIHPRYLITEKGGIRFDRGFAEPNDFDQQEAETDVAMITTSMVNSISPKYKEDSSPYKIIDKYIVHGEGQNGQ
jgi:hypothetical protein